MSIEQAIELKTLRRFLMNEIKNAFGLSPKSLLGSLISPICWPPANIFAKLGLNFDQHVAKLGFSEAARWVLPRFFVEQIETRGSEHLPAEGPLIVASNHPGTYDSLVVASQLPRNDVRIIASNIHFLRALPFTEKNFIFITLDAKIRMLALRMAVNHLRKGGAVFIFPGGTIEPDPAFMPGARESIGLWSKSIEVMTRMVDQTKLVLSMVSGVLAPECWHHPITHIRKERFTRQRVAEFIQVMQQMALHRKFNLKPKVTFSKPVFYEQLLCDQERYTPYEKIITLAQGLLEEHLINFPVAAQR
jgi:hypothetical protein